MANRTEWFEDLQKNISDLIAKSPAADIERNVRAMVTQTFSRLDLITREEFETQSALLERALARIAALEARLKDFEARVGPEAGVFPAPTAGGSSAAPPDA